jgi:hypothetical protein
MSYTTVLTNDAITYALKKPRSGNKAADHHLEFTLDNAERDHYEQLYREYLPAIKKIVRKHCWKFPRTDAGECEGHAAYAFIIAQKLGHSTALMLQSIKHHLLTFETYNRKHHLVEPQFPIDDATGYEHEPCWQEVDEVDVDTIVDGYTTLEKCYIDIARQITGSPKHASAKFRRALKEMFGYDDDRIDDIIDTIGAKMFA